MSWGHLADTWRTTLVRGSLCPGETWRTLGGQPSLGASYALGTLGGQPSLGAPYVLGTLGRQPWLGDSYVLWILGGHGDNWRTNASFLDLTRAFMWTDLILKIFNDSFVGAYMRGSLVKVHEIFTRKGMFGPF